MQLYFSPEAVESKINLCFCDKKLLVQAFVHRSFWNENQNLSLGHNERLEFLGDSVLGLMVAEYLYSSYPGLDEGVLSTLRSQLVDAVSCAAYVQKLEIASFLLLGKGEQMNNGKGRESILADLFESLIGAIYLDQGLEKVRQFFFFHFQEEVNRLVAKPQRNWKAELQDFAQKKYQQTPIYEVAEESGPAHSKSFLVGVWIRHEKWGEGEGSSKKGAQAEAAKNALMRIESNSQPQPK